MAQQGLSVRERFKQSVKAAKEFASTHSRGEEWMAISEESLKAADRVFSPETGLLSVYDGPFRLEFDFPEDCEGPSLKRVEIGLSYEPKEGGDYPLFFNTAANLAALGIHATYCQGGEDFPCTGTITDSKSFVRSKFLHIAVGHLYADISLLSEGIGRATEGDFADLVAKYDEVISMDPRADYRNMLGYPTP